MAEAEEKKKRKPRADTAKTLLEVYELLKGSSSRKRPLSITRIVNILKERGGGVDATRDTVKKVLEMLRNCYPQEIVCETADRKGGSGYTYHYYYQPGHGSDPTRNDVGRIQEVISGNKGASRETVLDFDFNGYGRDRKLHAVGRYAGLRPVQVGELDGRYYVIGQFPDNPKLYHFRIDLMSDITPRIQKRAVDGFSQYAANRTVDRQAYLASHPYMAYERDGEMERHIEILVRKIPGKPEASLTLLHDVFGDGWEVLEGETDSQARVRVRCIPDAMELFVRQYMDRVRIIGPEDVKKAVEDKLRERFREYFSEKDGGSA